MPVNEPKYWFPAKRYGWGWGFPSCWQGWAVMIGYIALLIPGAFWFPQDQYLASYLIYVFTLSALFIVICWSKGEPPRWRWGDRDSASHPPKSNQDS